MEWKRSRWHKKLRCISGSLETQREDIWRNTKSHNRKRERREHIDDQPKCRVRGRTQRSTGEALRGKRWSVPPPHKQHTSAHPSPRSLQAPDTSYAPCRAGRLLHWQLWHHRPARIICTCAVCACHFVPRWPDMNDTHYGEKDFTAWGAAL